MSALGNIKQAHEQNKLIESQKKSLKAKIEADEKTARRNLYNKALNDGTDRSDVVNRFNANTIANSADLSSISQQYQPYLTQMDYAQAQNTSDAWSGALESLGGIATSFLNKAPTSSDNKELISPTAAAGMKKAPI